MPYNRFSYADLTAQINVLSQLGDACLAMSNRQPTLRKAAVLIGSRIRTEIDRLARHRRKMKQWRAEDDTTITSAFADTSLTPFTSDPTKEPSNG